MKYVKLIFLGLVCCELLNQHASHCRMVAQQPMRFHQRDGIVIVFDLHEVLMKLDIKALLRNAFYALFTDPKNTLKFAYNYLDEQALDLSTQAIRNIFNAQQPISETWTLVYELKNEGFPLFLFSNIEFETFQELKVRYPDQFSLFQGFHTVRNDEIKKPSLAAYLDFEAFLKSFGYLRPLIIFIDDNKNNIAVARKIGWHAILYKNPQQLAKTLEQTLNSLRMKPSPMEPSSMEPSLMQRPAMLN